MSGEELTPIERLSAYDRGESIDRLPCVPIVGNTAARVLGVNVSSLRYDGALLARAHIEAYKLFKYDIIRIFTDLFTQAEAMGARVFCPLDETAYLESPAIEDVSKVDSIMPADPYKSKILKSQLEAIKIVVDEVGKEVSVTGAITCPFTNASFLIGAENIVRLTLRNPELVHKLCSASLETNINYANAIIDAGGAPSLTDAMSSSSVISPQQFKEFSYPYLKSLIDHIHSRGKKVTLHICGKTNKIWNLMADAGADCISIDNDADLLLAKNKVGERVRIMGNVKPSEIMLQGSREDVKLAVIDCIKKAHDNPKGFIVASGCSLPTETPFDNIKEMMNTVRLAGFPPDENILIS
ncbi:MAG TPA: uroporphyrinogen decarboxylase family protein [Clostridia bacterium]